MGISYPLNNRNEAAEQLPVLDVEETLTVRETLTEKPIDETEPELENQEDGKMVLSTDNLVKKYRQRTVVNHVSIKVRQGEIVGLL